MTTHTPDALASALPATLGNEVEPGAFWDNATTAAYQAERLAESGYVLVHTAPDEATVERLAEALVENSWPGASWEHTDEPARISARDYVECVLAALAGTSAQARHTADGATDGA